MHSDRLTDLNALADAALTEAVANVQLGSPEQCIPFVVAAVLSALKPEIEAAARQAYGLVGGAAS